MSTEPGDEVELIPRGNHGGFAIANSDDDDPVMPRTPELRGRIQGYGNTSFFNRRPGASVLFQGLFYAPATPPSERALQTKPPTGAWSLDMIFNVVWMIFFGWWIAAVYAIASVFLFLSFVGIPYGRLALSLAQFHLWPFGKFLVRNAATSPAAALSMDGIGGIIGYGVYAFVISIVVMPVQLVAAALSWFFVVYIPMAKAERSMMAILYKGNPLELTVNTEPSGDVVCAVHCAFNAHYYRYTVWGINIFLFNLSPFVVFSLFIGYPLPKLFGIEFPPIVLFCCSLASIVPLSYYIGMAISNVAAQTSFAVGALINATFGSVIELIIYWAAIRQGSLDQVVQAAVTGTLLGMLLLLPGLSMIFGGLKYPEQRFSAEAAGVSSVLLIVSVIGAFTPTIFYQIYGGYSLSCTDCNDQSAIPLPRAALNCTSCQIAPTSDLLKDSIFTGSVQPLMYVCAAILPIAYGIGLLFTLKTHQHLFNSGEGGGGHGEEAPAVLWPLSKCIVVLLCCTVAFALISEEMTEKMNGVLEQLDIDPAFAGLTIIGIIPSIAEYVAAIMFAVNDNVALSIEIGSSSAVQLSLIQVPVLVALSAIHKHYNNAEIGFTLIFPTIDLFAVMFAVLIVNYVSIDGRSNYFIGSALVIIYTILIAAFYFVPSSVRISSRE